MIHHENRFDWTIILGDRRYNVHRIRTSCELWLLQRLIWISNSGNKPYQDITTSLPPHIWWYLGLHVWRGNHVEDWDICSLWEGCSTRVSSPLDPASERVVVPIVRRTGLTTNTSHWNLLRPTCVPTCFIGFIALFGHRNLGVLCG